MLSHGLSPDEVTYNSLMSAPWRQGAMVDAALGGAADVRGEKMVVENIGSTHHRF